MSNPYDPNQNPRSGVSGPTGANAGYGQSFGQGYGQGFDEEETQQGYPGQAYGQPGYQPGAYARSAQGGQMQSGSAGAGQQGYAAQYGSPDANAPVIVPARSGRNWLPYLVVGIVLVALVCCVLPGAILIRNGIIFPIGTPTPSGPPAVGQLVYQTTFQPPDTRWPNSNGCAFAGGGYQITNNSTCIATYSNVPNDLSIDATVVQATGPTTVPHGIALRRIDPDDYYVFGITSAGSWIFVKYAANKAPQAIKGYQTNSAIKTGLGATNTLEVRAQGGNFYFFVNGTSVGQASDNSYASGLPGLTGNSGSTIEYANFKLSKLA
ncbi:MAG TPA: hypothetical protein VF120_07355 [Ktedonobacterales bacterium]